MPPGRKRRSLGFWCLCGGCYGRTKAIIARLGWQHAAAHYTLSLKQCTRHCSDEGTSFPIAGWAAGPAGLPELPQGSPQHPQHPQHPQQHPQPLHLQQASPAHADSPPSQRLRLAAPSTPTRSSHPQAPVSYGSKQCRPCSSKQCLSVQTARVALGLRSCLRAQVPHALQPVSINARAGSSARQLDRDMESGHSSQV